MSTFPGLAHAALTVSHLERSTAWYAALFGADPVLDEDEAGGAHHHTVWVLEGGHLSSASTPTSRVIRAPSTRRGWASTRSPSPAPPA